MASIIWILSIVTGEWSVDASRAILKGKAFLTEREGRGNFGGIRLGKEVRVISIYYILCLFTCYLVE